MPSRRVEESTLEQFRSAACSGGPAPAGVAVSAASASFALGLLAKTLKVSGRRKDFAGDPSKLRQLADAATEQSKMMMQIAQHDIEAFHNYMLSRRPSQVTGKSSQERGRDIHSAVAKAIEVPFQAARAAAAGLTTCAEATSLVSRVVAADLGAAASLLGAALRVFLLCIDSNVHQMESGASLGRAATTDPQEWQDKACRQEAFVVMEVTKAIETIATKQRRKP